jgi:hypothetical protein
MMEDTTPGQLAAIEAANHIGKVQWHLASAARYPGDKWNTEQAIKGLRAALKALEDAKNGIA